MSTVCSGISVTGSRYVSDATTSGSSKTNVDTSTISCTKRIERECLKMRDTIGIKIKWLLNHIYINLRDAAVGVGFIIVPFIVFGMFTMAFIIFTSAFLISVFIDWIVSRRIG